MYIYHIWYIPSIPMRVCLCVCLIYSCLAFCALVLSRLYMLLNPMSIIIIIYVLYNSILTSTCAYVCMSAGNRQLVFRLTCKRLQTAENTQQATP